MSMMSTGRIPPNCCCKVREQGHKCDVWMCNGRERWRGGGGAAVELGVIPALLDNFLSIDSLLSVMCNFFACSPESQLSHMDLLVGAVVLWDLVAGGRSL